jgi:glycine reductase
MDLPDVTHVEDWNQAIYSSMFRLNDRLAEVTRDLDPPETKTYDLDQRDSSLPNVVYVPVLTSSENRFGPYTNMGHRVYGISRLTQPWLLHPTEVLDGAICGTINQMFTWPVLETMVPYMCSRHGTDFNFRGCIVVRSNWESQVDKQLMANRAAQLATTLEADGAIVTTNVRGQRFVETILTVQALERAGVKTVLMTEEEDNEDGKAPPLLVFAPELVSVVSVGTGGVEVTFPAVERVIGFQKPEAHWFQERSPIHGRYTVSHTQDFYGAGRQGNLDF